MAGGTAFDVEFSGAALFTFSVKGAAPTDRIVQSAVAGLEHRICKHQARNQKHGEILRCAQNDKAGRSHLY